MSQEKIFRINLPTLFERVNERRREQGLPQVEPAMMAIRASIKFAIRQQERVDLKGEKVDVSEAEADALCETLGELFNVNLHTDESIAENIKPAAAPPAEPATESATEPAAVSMQPPPTGEEEGTPYVLPLFQFYAAINRERRTKGLAPAEPAVISVRTGIKFSIMRRRTLNFREDKLLLNEADLQVLDRIIAQQFDVALPGGLMSLCKTPAAEPAAKVQSAESAPAEAEGNLFDRLFSRIKGKPRAQQVRTYTLDTNNLLLSIITRRAYMGHKPITPAKVKSRCGKALSAELELEMDLDDSNISVSPEQLEAFVDVIRKEFDIMFDDLDDLLGKKTRT